MRAKAPLSILIALVVIVIAVLALSSYSMRQETKGIEVTDRTAAVAARTDFPQLDHAAQADAQVVAKRRVRQQREQAEEWREEARERAVNHITVHSPPR